MNSVIFCKKGKGRDDFGVGSRPDALARPPQSLEITQHPPERGDFISRIHAAGNVKLISAPGRTDRILGENRSLPVPLKNACAGKRSPEDEQLPDGRADVCNSDVFISR